MYIMPHQCVFLLFHTKNCCEQCDTPANCKCGLVQKYLFSVPRSYCCHYHHFLCKGFGDTKVMGENN